MSQAVTGCSRAITSWVFYGLMWKMYYFMCLQLLMYWKLVILNLPGLIFGWCGPLCLLPTHWGYSQMGNKLGRRLHGLDVISKALFQLWQPSMTLCLNRTFPDSNWPTVNSVRNEQRKYWIWWLCPDQPHHSIECSFSLLDLVPSTELSWD